MSSEQSSNAPVSLVRRLGRWARGDRYMVGAYPPEWEERAPSDAPVVAAESPTVASTVPNVLAVPAATAVASQG